jgi:hypothetical protein
MRRHCARLTCEFIELTGEELARGQTWLPIKDNFIIDLWDQVSSSLRAAEKQASTTGRGPTQSDRRRGRVRTCTTPPIFHPSTPPSPLSHYTFFVGVDDDDNPLYVELPVFSSLKSKSPDFVHLSTCTSLAAVLPLLSVLWSWVHLVHASDRFYLGPSAIVSFFGTFPYTVMVAILTDETPPLLLSDASLPTELDEDAPNAPILPSRTTDSGIFPNYWLLMHNQHFVPAKVQQSP